MKHHLLCSPRAWALRSPLAARIGRGLTLLPGSEHCLAPKGAGWKGAPSQTPGETPRIGNACELSSCTGPLQAQSAAIGRLRRLRLRRRRQRPQSSASGMFASRTSDGTGGETLRLLVPRCCSAPCDAQSATGVKPLTTIGDCSIALQWRPTGLLLWGQPGRRRAHVCVSSTRRQWRTAGSIELCILRKESWSPQPRWRMCGPRRDRQHGRAMAPEVGVHPPSGKGRRACRAAGVSIALIAEVALRQGWRGRGPKPRPRSASFERRDCAVQGGTSAGHQT